jgi:hypothetical protein
MSWHYSLALLDQLLRDYSQDGELWGRLKSTRIAERTSFGVKRKASSNPSPSGMTLPPSMDARGVELWISLLAASRVRTSATPAKAQESTEPDLACGWRYSEWFAKYDRDSSLWRTSQLCLDGEWEEFSETWPRAGSMRSGRVWVRTTAERLTIGSGSGYWSTPQSFDANDFTQKPGSLERRKTKGGCSNLREVVKIWPTPSVCGNYNRKGSGKTSGDGLATAVAMYPTPTTQDAHNNNNSQQNRNTPPLNVVAGGSLNPDWVELLMGYPMKWTCITP